MSKWYDSHSIKQAVLQKWNSGQILSSTLKCDDLFPMKIKLKGPTREEMSTNFAQTLDWIESLKRQDKNMLGYGYVLEEKEVHHRLIGKNTIPTHAVIPTLNDAMQIIKKQSELQLFEQNSKALLQEWECLLEWVLKNPFHIISLGDNCNAIIQVLRWFTQNEQRDLYLRQLTIEGVDTKFIESHKELLMQLLDIVMQPEQINFSSKIFEIRYYLKTKPSLIRFRILDDSLAPYGCSDISLPTAQFRALHPPFSHVFIVENEINFLSFPPVRNACVIFGAGYRIDLFKDIPWLRDKEIYYWGDIDTHGLNILSKVRSFLPQTQSFLMSTDILLSHRPLWVEEKSQFMAEIINLTPQEHELAFNLQNQYWGKGVRLEQERVRFLEVEHFIKALNLAL